jgi:hypothetical protein
VQERFSSLQEEMRLQNEAVAAANLKSKEEFDSIRTEMET